MMSTPLIMVAPNGARHKAEYHPALPIHLPHIIETAHACYAAGADALHLHIRDAQGRHSLDAGLYREALQGISQQVPGLALQITTEAGGRYDVAAQLQCIKEVMPEYASVAVREIARAPHLADQFYGTCCALGCRVQHILYDLADLKYLRSWQKNGVVRETQIALLFVLGRYGAGEIAKPSDVALIRDALGNAPPPWMVCAFGRNEHACLEKAAYFGADLRVGFENSIHAEDGSAHRDNAASIVALRSRLERRGA